MGVRNAGAGPDAAIILDRLHRRIERERLSEADPRRLARLASFRRRVFARLSELGRLRR